MKKSRLFKAEVVVLACVAVLWGVNLRTHCVPRATAGALRQVIKVAPHSRLARKECAALKELDADLAHDLLRLVEDGADHSEHDPNVPVPDAPDPFEILNQQYNRDQAAADAMVAPLETQLRQSIKNEIDLSYKQYLIDYNTLRKSKAPPEWFEALNGRYQKMWVEIKSRIEPGLRELEAQRKESLTKLAFQHAEKQMQLQTYQTMMDEGLITWDAGLREMYRVAGYDFSAGAFKTAAKLLTSPQRQRRDRSIAYPSQFPLAFESADAQARTEARVATTNGQPPTVAAIASGNQDGPCAMVNGAIVHEGETVDGFRVRSISPDSVEFEKDGNVWVQKVN